MTPRNAPLGGRTGIRTPDIPVHATRPQVQESIAHRLSLRPSETEFDRGIRRFGYLLTSAMTVLVLLVFVVLVLVLPRLMKMRRRHRL